MHPATVAPAVPATVPSVGSRRRGQLFSADMGAMAALTINLGLIAVMLGSFLSGISSHSFLGSSLVSEFDRGFRYRLLAVFSQASFDQAVFIVVSIMLTVAVPAERPSTMRRTALYCASALGVFVAFGALLRAVALITFLGTAAALAVGSTVSALAAIPVAAAATAWAVVLLTRRSDETV